MSALGKRTSNVCHQSPRSALAIAVGDEVKPAFRTSTSQVPIFAAALRKPWSSVTLTAKIELFVPSGKAACVSPRVASCRPRRTRLDAPALAKATAVARPMPLPCGSKLLLVQFYFFKIGRSGLEV